MDERIVGKKPRGLGFDQAAAGELDKPWSFVEGGYCREKLSLRAVELRREAVHRKGAF
jgi:hypothetical protein